MATVRVGAGGEEKTQQLLHARRSPHENMLTVASAKLLVILSFVAGPCSLVTKTLQRFTASDDGMQSEGAESSSETASTVLRALRECLTPENLKVSSSEPVRFDPASIAPSSGAEGLLVSDLAKKDLPWGAWLGAASSKLLPRGAVLNAVSKRHDLGAWEYPPLEESEASGAAALAAQLKAFVQSCKTEEGR